MAAGGSNPCYSCTCLRGSSSGSSHAVQTNCLTPGLQVTNYHVLANIFRQLRPDQLKGQGRPLVAKLTLLGVLSAGLHLRAASAHCSLWRPDLQFQCLLELLS